MSIITIFLGIVIIVLLFVGVIFTYKKIVTPQAIYDLKQTDITNIPGISVSSKFYFSCWVYINSFTIEGVKNDTSNKKYDPLKAEKGKPIFYYGETMNINDGYALDSVNNKSKKLVYLQLGANSPKLQYYYTTNDSTPYNFINITESLPIQKWSHIVISTNDKIIECYLDGKLLKTKDAGTNTQIDTTTPNNTDIKIGKQDVQKKSDIFISKLQMFDVSADAKTVKKLYKKGPGTGLKKNTNQFDLQFEVSKNFYSVF